MVDPDAPQPFPRPAIAEVLNRLPDVRWDRFVELPGAYLKVYGWLERKCTACGGTGTADVKSKLAPPDEPNVCTVCGGSCVDARQDFVLLEFEVSGAGELGVGYTTSSAEHSNAIGAVLYGIEAGHDECQRVENDSALVGSVDNVIRSVIVP